ncbi:uncharacterized protein BJ171DRAFT_485699 [Polychytrium aggregatum]|uniref:uncharacterized protein n=1 Tax=Polychytrium aggregatum TaxID=110093 RepID=UPI0022FF07F4|nr:uncharacterized protein BJ171DRAFT_485699 [Polychytrium aggregatum]KAI9209190.1 hypothetical protein BJ171DRAFT_485699 [Polychytrium aggregatum]
MEAAPTREQIRQKILEKKGQYTIRDFDGYAVKVHRDTSQKLSITIWDHLEPEAVYVGTFEESLIAEAYAELTSEAGILRIEEGKIDTNLVPHQLDIRRRSAPTLSYILKRELIPASIVLRNEIDRLRWVGPQGAGVAKSMDEALKRLSVDPDNLEQVSPDYIHGRLEFMSEHYAKAADYFRKAAYKDHGLSQNALGLCHEIGGDPVGAARWFEKATESGCFEGATNLGRCYLEGIGVEQDYTKAVEQFSLGAEHDDMEALNYLGLCYQRGHGVEVDCEKAVDYYERAAEMGHADAQNNLGQCFEHGSGTDQDEVMAFALYQKATKQKHKGARKNLAVCYHRGIGAQADKNAAICLYQEIVDHGDADIEVHYNLGTLYYGALEYDEAVRSFRRAATNGHIMAQKYLADCFRFAQGVVADTTAAVRWYQRAADQGCVEAQCSLVQCYFDGVGVPQNYALGMEWYRRTRAVAPDLVALQSLQSTYGPKLKELGDGYCEGTFSFGKNEPKAVEYYQMASELGCAAAQNKLGYCYEVGLGGLVPSNELALIHYEKAAAQGLAHGQYNLGVCYEKGIFVDVDLDIALAWYQKAAIQSHKQAQKAVDRLSKKRADPAP